MVCLATLTGRSIMEVHFRGTCLCFRVILLFVTMGLLFHSFVGSNLTCSNIRRKRLDVMHHCTFEETDKNVTFPQVICDLQDVIRDSNAIKYFFYLHTRFKFTFIQEYDNFSIHTNDFNVQPTYVSDDKEKDHSGGGIMSVCVGLSNAFVTKVNSRDPWENASIGELPSLGVFFLSGFKDGFLDTSFNASAPVGIVDVDKKCWTEKRASSCIIGVQMLRLVRSPTEKKSFVESSFWEIAKSVYLDILGLKISRLHLEFNPKFIVRVHTFFEEALKGISVEELQMRGGQLQQGPSLPRLPMLKILDLTNDAISSMSTEKFPNLERLILAVNNLSELPSGLLHLSKLKYLDLSSNPLTKFEKPGGLFLELQDLHNLQWLNLAHVPLRHIRMIRPLLESSSINLQGLNLSHTEISVLVNEDIFKNQTSLQSMDLSGNQLKNIPPSLFRYNENLTVLDLSYNSFSTGPKLILGTHTTLERLNLAHNRIEYPNNIVMSGSVKFLDLSGNNISYWDDVNIFSQPSLRLSETTVLSTVVSGKSPWAHNLDVSNNQIITVSQTMGKSMEILESIDLGGNLLNCMNCHTPEFQQWLNSSNIEVLNYGTKNELRCSLPSSERGKRVAEVTFDSENCTEKHRSGSLYLIVGSPIAILLILLIACGGLLYKFRFETMYLLHLLARSRKRGVSASEEYQYDAFVCFSGKDRAWVIGKLLPKLENGPENFRLCLHERDFALGSYISQNIVSSMHCSKHTIMILTNNFVKSEWCRWELDFANHKLFENKHNFLIFVEYERLDRSKLPQHLRYLMDTRTYLEWPEEECEEENAWRRLKETLGASIDSGIMMQQRHVSRE